MRRLATVVWIAALAFSPVGTGCGEAGNDTTAGLGAAGVGSTPAIAGAAAGATQPVAGQTSSSLGAAGSIASPSTGPAGTGASGSPNVGGTAGSPLGGAADSGGAGDSGAVAGTGSLSGGTGGGTAGSSAMGGMGGMGTAGSAGGATASPGSLTPIMRGDAPSSSSASTAGPYKVMSYTSGFAVTLYGGGTIWYPEDAEPPFGAVAVCPGFVAAQSSIINWGRFLASHGIVVLTMDTLTPLDVVDQRAEELMDALASIKGENARSGSPLMGKIDTMRLGVMGWSMGGGGTWLAASMHPELRSAVSFAGHIITAVNQNVMTNMVPTLLLAGSTDTAILGGGMSQPVYDQIPESTPKMVWEVRGAGHDVANSPSNSSGAIGRYGLSWQKVFLEGDMRYRPFLLEMAPNASYFKTNVK